MNLDVSKEEIYLVKIVPEVFTVVCHTSRIVDTFEINATELVIVTLHKALNPVPSDMLVTELQNQISYKLGSRRDPTS